MHSPLKTPPCDGLVQLLPQSFVPSSAPRKVIFIRLIYSLVLNKRQLKHTTCSHSHSKAQTSSTDALITDLKIRQRKFSFVSLVFLPPCTFGPSAVARSEHVSMFGLWVSLLHLLLSASKDESAVALTETNSNSSTSCFSSTNRRHDSTFSPRSEKAKHVRL